MARPELIFGLVGAAGTRLSALSSELHGGLRSFGYTIIDIRVSGLLANFQPEEAVPENDEYQRVRFLQDRGDRFRRSLGSGDALALASVATIRKERAAITGNPDLVAHDHAFILNQLKHPAEVDLLRQVYGKNLILVAGHAPRNKRVQSLRDTLSRENKQTTDLPVLERQAMELIEIDEKEADDLGQNTRDTYPMADFFSNLAAGEGYDVRRFLNLFFGHPFHTPSPEEYAMYQASAVALRSSDSGRQVGAVITAHAAGSAVGRTADIVAVGANEVPRARGGYYWDGDSPDNRDHRLLAGGADRAQELKLGVLRELLEKIKAKNWFLPEIAQEHPRTLATELLSDLRRTQFMDIGEFGRPVHAEMAALIDAARRGVAVNGHSMYVTAFPCHNCAKHIIAAGISRVIYLEPYPKSRAGSLHGEELELESISGADMPDKVVCYAFSGIAPRQYRQLFSMAERGKDKGHSLNRWSALSSALVPPHVPPNSFHAYIPAEREALKRLRPDIYRWTEQH
jgi:cytidine deaminase